MKKLKVAIIGTGFIGPVHAGAVRSNPNLAELTAIAGVSQEEASQAAEKLNIPYCTEDYLSLLKRDDIDVVHICTPNFLHYPMVKACLEHGKHVLCEKPLALSSEEARELNELAESRGIKAAVNYNLRYYPMVQEMKARNEAKDKGEIFALQGSYLQDWLLYEDDYSWRLESRLSGASRAVADIGTHWMDMAQYVTGQKISSVYARFSRMHEQRKKSPDGKSLTFNKGQRGEELVSYPVDTEDFAQIFLEFDKGICGNLTVSQVTAGYKNFMEIRQSGRSDSFSWNSESPNRLEIGHRDRANEVLLKDPSLLNERAASMSAYPGGHQEGYGDTFRYLVKNFYSHILDETEGREHVDYPTLKDGLDEMILCEAIIKSADEGCWVEIKR